MGTTRRGWMIDWQLVSIIIKMNLNRVHPTWNFNLLVSAEVYSVPDTNADFVCSETQARVLPALRLAYKSHDIAGHAGMLQRANLQLATHHTHPADCAPALEKHVLSGVAGKAGQAMIT